MQKWVKVSRSLRKLFQNGFERFDDETKLKYNGEI